MSTQAEVFTKDLEQFHLEQKHYLDASGNFIGYDMKRGVKPLHTEEQKKLIFDNKIFFKGHGIITDPTCSMDDPTLAGGKPVGLSNINFGHITNPNEFSGTMIQDLGWMDASSNMAFTSSRGLRVRGGLVFKSKSEDFLTGANTNIGFYMNTDEILLKGELTAPLVEAQDEQGSEEETQWYCKGCSKFFATKASLKRHHERKKSCKDFCEKPVSETFNVSIPDKPYIIEWVDQCVSKAVSGESEKPYCKHCDIEFANRGNLNKHLAKSSACDKLAKQEFLQLLKQEDKSIPEK
jgi:hypothetical protein